MKNYLLFGPLTVDKYIDEDIILPGGGVLNIAWHFNKESIPYSILSRTGEDKSDMFDLFCNKNSINYSRQVEFGRTASINIRILDDKQPFMDNYNAGLWSKYELTAEDKRLISEHKDIHAVFTVPIYNAMTKLFNKGLLQGKNISVDYHDFRYFDERSFSETLDFVNIAFIGWTGSEDEKELSPIINPTFQKKRTTILTLGSKGCLLIDGKTKTTTLFKTKALDPLGSSIGCGDAFIAGFLAAKANDKDIKECIESGNKKGALATEWLRPLPNTSY